MSLCGWTLAVRRACSISVVRLVRPSGSDGNSKRERQMRCVPVLMRMLVLFGSSVADDPPAESTWVGDRLQLFLDERLIDRTRELRRVLQAPRPAEMVLEHGRPWEDSTMYDLVVIKDGDRFRMGYRDNSNKPLSSPFLRGLREESRRGSLDEARSRSSRIPRFEGRQRGWVGDRLKAGA